MANDTFSVDKIKMIKLSGTPIEKQLELIQLMEKCANSNNNHLKLSLDANLMITAILRDVSEKKSTISDTKESSQNNLYSDCDEIGLDSKATPQRGSRKYGMPGGYQRRNPDQDQARV